MNLTWTHLILLGFTWTHLISLELTWTHLLDITWVHLDSLGLTWTQLDSLGLTWYHLGSFGLTWTHLDSLDLSWTHLDSLGLTLIPLISVISREREHLIYQGGKGRNIEAKREKIKGTWMIFEIHFDLTYSCVRTHERNETIYRLVSAPQPPIKRKRDTYIRNGESANNTP